MRNRISVTDSRERRQVGRQARRGNGVLCNEPTSRNRRQRRNLKDAKITLDTALSGRSDAFNPAELLLAALSACMIKGIERVAPILKFRFEEIEVEVHGVRQDSPPLMASIDYTIRVKTDESDQRLALLHDNVRKYGTVFNTVAPGTRLEGSLIRSVA